MYIPPIGEDVPNLDNFSHFTEKGRTITLLVAENEDGTVAIVRWFLEIESYSNETISREQYEEEKDNRNRCLPDVENGIITLEFGVVPTIESFRGLDEEMPDNGLITTALLDRKINRARGEYLIVLRIPDEGETRIAKIKTEQYNKEKETAGTLAAKMLQKATTDLQNGIKSQDNYHR